MKIKSLFVVASLLLLSACFSSRESLGRYNIPVSDIKDSTKEGKVCSKYIFPFYTFYSDSDLTVEKARKEAGIKQITAIEKSSHLVMPLIPLYIKTCVIVKGN